MTGVQTCALPIFAGSCCETVETLRKAGADVLGVASIFTYGMKKGLENLAAHNIENHSLSDLDTLVEVAVDTGYIKPDDKNRILSFRENPADTGWMKQEVQ